VDEKKLKFLDYFEDHPNMYTRTLISVEHNSSVKAQANIPNSSAGAPNLQENQPTTRSECWCYFYNDDGSLSELPCMDNYDSNGSHGLEYDRTLDVEFDK
jgi:hypothetical protein